MLRLFRKIREKLVKSGSTGNYILYAIGEVFLVVIGILIALQVNNWNEKRKNKDKIIQIFTEIQKDLINDVEEVKEILPWLKKYDTVAVNILNRKYSKTDYLDPKHAHLVNIMRDDYPFFVSERGYQLLSENKDIIPGEFNTLVTHIDFLYNEEKKILELQQEELRKITTKFKEKIQNEFAWTSLLALDSLPDVALDYFLKDPIYRNKILAYYRANSNFEGEVIIYRSMCFSLFFRIQNITRAELSTPLDFEVDVNFSKDEIAELKGEYILRNIESKSKHIIYELDELLFYKEDRGFWSRGGSLLFRNGIDSIGILGRKQADFIKIKDNKEEFIGLQLMQSDREEIYFDKIFE